MDIQSPVSHIPGVGPAYAKALREHGLETVHDVLHFTPSRYIDFTHPVTINTTRIGQEVTISGVVRTCAIERTSRQRMLIVRAEVEDTSGIIPAVWFNQAYLKNVLKPGAVVHLHGAVMAEVRVGKVLRNPLILTDPTPHPHSIYSERSGLESGRFARIVKNVLPYARQMVDPLPNQVREQYHLLGLGEAITRAHLPATMEQVSHAKERLALDELWTIMTVMRLAKRASDQEKSPQIDFQPARLLQTLDALPFQLTDYQHQALKEILADMQQISPMRRLLNGDVGSGKTAVAFVTACAALTSGQKAVVLAPTTVLAQQHYHNWLKWYSEYPSFLFTSGIYMHNGIKVTRQKALQELAETEAAFVCGTHSIFHQDLHLDSGVGLVVVDEQHRFGVMQRAQLVSANRQTVPHLLSLSATPIPRTAALVLYGDLEISVLREKPAGRIPVVTKLASEKSRPFVYQFIDQLISKGQQVFVVCPIIGQSSEATEQSDRLFILEERKAVIDEFDKLQHSTFAHRRIGLLHGRLKAEEKDAVLEQFRSGELDLLISTSVIEVGVDIPDASVMVVEGAEFFGLAQLHQLRGRVGRGDEQSYCFLFASNWSSAVTDRLHLLEDYADGFSLAEKDLELRGPGELYGTMQAGVTPFRYATLSNGELVHTAQRIAEDLLALPDDQWPAALTEWIDKHQSAIHRE